MRRRRLAQVVAVCNAVVLAGGLAVLTTGFSGPPDIAFGGEAQAVSSTPSPPDEQSRLPATGADDRPLADPDARTVDLPAHALDYLPPVPRVASLVGDPDLDGGCAWLEFDDGPQAVRWAPGFQAAFLPGGDNGETFDLVDASGRVVASEGDTVEFTGARSGGSERLERCHVGDDHVWYVDEVAVERSSP